MLRAFPSLFSAIDTLQNSCILFIAMKFHNASHFGVDLQFYTWINIKFDTAVS